MRVRILKFIFLSVTVHFSCANASVFDETKTITIEENATLFKAIYKSTGVIPSYLVATEKPDFYYSLSSNSEVVGFYDLPNKTVKGWRFQLFDDSALEPEINSVYALHNIKPSARNSENLSPTLGCLTKNPLRYGDVTHDTKPELIILGQDEFGALNTTVFSPELKKAIFSLRLATYDTRKNDRQSLPPGQEPLLTDPLANAPTDGQYLSLISRRAFRPD